MDRDERLQNFLTSLEETFASVSVLGDGRGMLDKMFVALKTPGRAGTELPQRLPVCHFLDEALAIYKAETSPLARLCNAFRMLEPTLAWTKRHATGPFASDNFCEGHANTLIVGNKGAEVREDVMIGASLLAPHVRYPDHHHPPEEVYLVLSPGRFRHGDSDWFEPGVGGTLYNEPDINHAMASDDAPLFAFWCLMSKTGS
jgi:hypothetical protein